MVEPRVEVLSHQLSVFSKFGSQIADSRKLRRGAVPDIDTWPPGLRALMSRPDIFGASVRNGAPIAADS
jgi:hypothetical protein